MVLAAQEVGAEVGIGGEGAISAGAASRTLDSRSARSIIIPGWRAR